MKFWFLVNLIHRVGKALEQKQKSPTRSHLLHLCEVRQAFALFHHARPFHFRKLALDLVSSGSPAFSSRRDATHRTCRAHHDGPVACSGYCTTTDLTFCFFLSPPQPLEDSYGSGLGLTPPDPTRPAGAVKPMVCASTRFSAAMESVSANKDFKTSKQQLSPSSALPREKKWVPRYLYIPTTPGIAWRGMHSSRVVFLG